MTTSDDSGNGSQEKTPEQQRQDRINAREQAAEQAREARQAERQSWRDGRKATVSQQKQTREQNRITRQQEITTVRQNRRAFAEEFREIFKLTQSTRQTIRIIGDLGKAEVKAQQAIRNAALQKDTNERKKNQELQDFMQLERRKVLALQEKNILDIRKQRQLDKKNGVENSKSHLQSRITELQRIIQTNPSLSLIIQPEINKLNDRIISLNNEISSITTAINSIQTDIDNLDSSLLGYNNQQSEKLDNAIDRWRQEENAIRTQMVKQEEFRRFQEKKQIEDTNLKNIGKDCICPAVYDPVVVDGITYSNSCQAVCAGKTVPANPQKPTLPPPNNKVCLQVITCGSDGNTYSDSCLPEGVYPIKIGGSCSGVTIPSQDLIKNPSTRPPVDIVDDSLVNVITTLPAKPGVPPPPIFVCGTDNTTYSISPGWGPGPVSTQYGQIRYKPVNVGIKHVGRCGV